MNEQQKPIELLSTNGRIQSLLNLGIHLNIRRTNTGDFLKASLYNLVQIMRNAPIFKDRARYDVFSEEIRWRDDEEIDSRLLDHHISQIRYTCEDRWAVAFKDKDVWSALDIVSRENPVNPLHDHFDKLRGLWDKKKHGSIASKYFSMLGAKDTPLNRAYSRRFFLAMIARSYATMDNLVKADWVAVLYGDQRIGKSTALRETVSFESFGEKYFGDTAIRIDDYRETVQKIQGKLLYELQEFAGRPKDPEYEKSFFSMRKDDVRYVYKRTYTQVPRRTTWAITTNHKSIARDASGSSRFWFVDLGDKKIDIDALREALPLMWSQSLATYDKWIEAKKILDKDPKDKDAKKILEYGNWFLSPEENALRKEVERDFEDAHPMTDDVERIIDQMRKNNVLPLKATSIYRRLQEELCPFVEKGARHNQKIISDILMRNGYRFDRKKSPNDETGDRIRGWWPPT